MVLSESSSAEAPTLTAGLELDALVAEKVMGQRIRWLSPSDPIMGQPGSYRDVPEYSTDITAAWQVVERLTGAGTDRFPRGLNVVISGGELEQGYTVEFICRKRERVFARSANGLPEAICLAALKAQDPNERGILPAE